MNVSDAGSEGLDDPARRPALDSSGLLDSGPEEEFDRFTRLAAELARAPVALISLVAAERQFFKSAAGSDEPSQTTRETTLAYALCQHVTRSGSPLVIEDTRIDERVSADPAIEEFDVGAYAGVPLTTARGHTLGTLCVLDTRPREWSSAQLEALADIAAAVLATIELRLAVEEAERLAALAAEREAGLHLFSKQMPAIGWTTDNDLVLTAAYGSLLDEIARDTAWQGASLRELYANVPDSPVIAAHVESLAGRNASYEIEIGAREFHVVTEPLRLEDGRIVGVVGLARDVTDERRRARWAGGRQAVLELIAADAPLTATYERLFEAFTAAYPGTALAVIAAGEAVERGQRVFADPALPTAYVGALERAVDGSDPDLVGALQEGAYREIDPESTEAGLFSSPESDVKVHLAGFPDESGRSSGLIVVHVADPALTDRGAIEAAAELAGLARSRYGERRALERSEQRALRLFEDAQDMISLIGRDGELLSANGAFADALGYSRAELLEKKIFDLLPESSASVVRDVASRLAVGEGAGVYELEVFAKDGRLLTLEVSTQSVHEDGRFIGSQSFARDVTARKQADRALRESEQRYQLIVTGTSDGFWDWDVKGHTVYYSPRWKEMLGYDPDEIAPVPEAWIDLLHPEDREERLARVNASLEEGVETYETEYRLRHKDGSYRWIQSRGKAIFDEQGRTVRFAGSHRDVTEQRRLAAELAERERFLQTIVDRTPQAITVRTVDCRLLSSNRAGLALYGVDSEDVMLGQDVSQLVATERRGEYVELHRKAAAGEAGEMTFEWTTVSGDRRIVYAQLLPFPTEGSQNVLMISEDITERHAVAATLEMHRDVVKHMDVGLHVYELIDPDDAGSLVLVEANAGADEALGSAELSLVGQTILDAFPELAETGIPEIYRQVALGGKPFELGDVEYGDERVAPSIFFVRAFPLPQRRVGITFTNVTSQRTLESSLRQSQKLEAVGQLAGGVAHDFNNLLTAISGYTAFALGRLTNHDHEIRSDLEEVQKASERARALTQQLLAFSRRQVLQPRTLDVNEIINDSVRLLARLLGEDIEIIADLNVDVAAVRADRGQLEQVVMNLALNARDAMTSGGKLSLRTEPVELSEGQVSGVAAGAWVRLSVEDDGSGIEPKTLEKIFDPFFTTKEVGQGTGLGLATVYGIVEQSHGQITVTSTPGVGTRFDVYLPAVEADVAPATKPTDIALVGGSERILLVEDDAIVRELVFAMLEAQGYDVTPAATPADALAKARVASFDMLMTDVVMPKMTGRELAEEMARVQPGLSVLYVSGYTADVVLARGISDEEVAFLQKPFTIHELGRKVRAVLDARANRAA